MANVVGIRPTSRASATDEWTRRHPEIMTAPHSPHSPDDATRKTDLNLTQVAAAALAAVTTAVLGSELGAAGTLIGAAGASVITTVGTAVYQASLERSRSSVRSLAKKRARPLPTSPVDRRLATLRWGTVVVGALGAFLLAMTAITGFEWINGKTVGGNGTGTTIGQVVTDQPGPRRPATPPAPPSPSAPASETPTETTVPPTSTTTPDGGASVDQSPTKSSDRPAPSEVTPTSPPLIRLPVTGG